MFIWTFDGVMRAIALGIVVLWFGLWGLIVLLDKIIRKYKSFRGK